MARMIIVVLAAALMYFGMDKFVLAPQRAAAGIAPPPATPPATPALSAVSSKSIAVLPFENLSEDRANAYFASGMQDMILTKLADIADLKVI